MLGNTKYRLYWYRYSCKVHVHCTLYRYSQLYQYSRYQYSVPVPVLGTSTLGTSTGSTLDSRLSALGSRPFIYDNIYDNIYERVKAQRKMQDIERAAGSAD